MRILFLSNLYPPYALGGYEILCRQVVENLERRGHEAFVLTSDHGANRPRPEPDPPYVERTLHLIRPFDQPGRPDRFRRAVVGSKNAEITRKVIKRWRPDIIFVWSLLRLSVGPACAAQDSGIPVAYTFNDQNIAGYLPSRWALRPRALVAGWMDRYLLPKTTLRDLNFRHSTCISQRLKDILLEQGVAAQRTEVIYQGVPLERFPPKACPGHLHTPLRLLYAGQLHHYKGVHTLLDAARRIAPELPLTVTIAGNSHRRL